MSIAFDMVSDFWEEQLADDSAIPSEEFGAKYQRIIARLKELAAKIGSHMWELGDLLLEADADYNPQDLGIPSYMLIGSHPPNFWKQMSDSVGLSVASLKLYANVARAFPPEKRCAELTWSHHLVAYIYVDRDKYLRVCIDRGTEEIGKPHTIRWLEQYVDEQEHCVTSSGEPSRTVTIEMPLAMMRKFSDLARHYYHKSVNEVVSEAMRPALEAYLEKKRAEISLEFFDYEDGKTWPFGADAKKKLAPKRAPRALATIRRIA